MAMIEDALDSVSGNAEFACIVVKDYREKTPMIHTSAKTGNTPSGNAPVSAVNAVTQAVLETGVNPLAANSNPYTEKIFFVQFNPKDLQIHTNCTDMYFADSQVKDNEQVNIQDTPKHPTLDLSLSLIFDHVNVFDAFMWDKARNLATLNGLVGAGASVAKVFTVQPEVEGFIAAIRNQFTRCVTFQWGRFSFTGHLEYVKAKYTMFSVSGRPIRANVDLRIAHKMDDTLLESGFYCYFKESFGGDDSNLVRAQQYVQSLLNLGL